MRKYFIAVVLTIIAIPSFLHPQPMIINDFEAMHPDQWLFVSTLNADTQSSYCTMQKDSSIIIQGNSSLSLDWGVDNCETFGGLSRIEYWMPGDSVLDLSFYDTLSFWCYNQHPVSVDDHAEFRFILFDAGNSPESPLIHDADSCEVYYSFHFDILDSETGWQEIKIPLKQVDFFGDWGFYYTGWYGIEGNRLLNKDQIKGYAFEFAVTAPADSPFVTGVIKLDFLKVFTKRARVDFLFNGASVPANVDLLYSGENGSAELSEENPYSGSTSIKWTTSETELFTGPFFQVKQPLDYIYHWHMNPLSFKLRMGEGRCDLRILITDDDVDGDGPDRPFAAEYILPKPIYNLYGTWQEYRIPLKDFNRFAGFDNGDFIEPGIMDSCRISTIRFQIADSSGLNCTFYLDDVALGNFPDDGKPKQPQFFVFPLAGQHQNLIDWTDSCQGDEETYSIYYSDVPVNKFNYRTDEVEVAASGLTQGDAGYLHDLIAPVNDAPASYYYAVTVVDGNGIESNPVECRFIESMAKGTAVIQFAPDFSYIADGHLDEWIGFKPFCMYPSDGSGTVVAGTEINSDTDLSADVWLACDQDNLFIAFDVTDDSLVFYDGSNNLWESDCPQLYIGMYDAHNLPHQELERGEEPDYHILFNSQGIHFLNPNGDMMEGGSTDYFFGRVAKNRYCIEAKIALNSLAESRVDSLFRPAHRMRVPVDISINDRDNGDQREGILTYSKFNNDHSWQNVGLWAHTWIWNETTEIQSAIRPAPLKYTLMQNYPNPFNPNTQIDFYLPDAGHISIKVYNLNGQLIKFLVDDYKNSGKYSVRFDGTGLASGIYFYKLQSNDFSMTKKMVLLQ